MDLNFFIILVRQHRDEDHTSGRSDSSLDGVLVQQTVPCITFTCFIHIAHTNAYMYMRKSWGRGGGMVDLRKYI